MKSPRNDSTSCFNSEQEDEPQPSKPFMTAQGDFNLSGPMTLTGWDQII